MNQKGFANIVIIVLVVVLVGALGYVTFIRKPAPVEQPQTNNSQNTQPTTPPLANNIVSQNPPPTNPGKELSGLAPITFPSYCSFSGSAENGWMVDCGKNTKNDARKFMEKILETQGWKFCDSGLGSASWWKNGVYTSVSESSNSSSAASYPFRVFQSKGAEETACQ